MISTQAGVWERYWGGSAPRVNVPSNGGQQQRAHRRGAGLFGLSFIERLRWVKYEKALAGQVAGCCCRMAPPGSRLLSLLDFYLLLCLYPFSACTNACCSTTSFSGTWRRR